MAGASGQKLREFRSFHHEDGRGWYIRTVGVELQLRILVDDGPPIERTRKYPTSTAAEQEEARLVEEQRQAGFREHTAPDAWRGVLDELVEVWRIEDPAFDATAQRREVLECTLPSAEQTVQALIQSEDHKVWSESSIEGGRLLGSWTGGDDTLARTAQRFLRDHLPAVLPALLLGLRHPDRGANARIRELLVEAKPRLALPALLSTLERPGSGGPAIAALTALGSPDAATADRLLAVLREPDAPDEIASQRVIGAASVLCEFASDQRFVDALAGTLNLARRHDSMAWAILRAAEVSHDARFSPHVAWMEKSSHFTEYFSRQRIRAVLAALRAHG